MNRFSSVLIRKVRPNSLRFATSEERIEGLSTNLSILGKSKGNAPITIDCIDLHQHPSADVALFELDPMHSRAQERRFDFHSKLFITFKIIQVIRCIKGEGIRRIYMVFR